MVRRRNIKKKGGKNMQKKKTKQLEPDGKLAALISQLSELEGWELRDVIKSTLKLRRAIRSITRAEARRAKEAKRNKDRAKDMKGLKYERTK